MKRLIMLTIIPFFLVMTACSSHSPSYETIDDFTFINQNHRNFGTDDLHGHIWIADFIFTKCETVCQPMTIEMANLQEELKEKGVDVQFVSFTVDPEVDRPERLKKYILDFTDDLSNWHLLTGYTQEEIELFAQEQFRTMVQKPSSSSQVIHGTNFYLINQDGQLIGDYNYIDPTYYESIIEDIEKLLN